MDSFSPRTPTVGAPATPKNEITKLSGESPGLMYASGSAENRPIPQNNGGPHTVIPSIPLIVTVSPPTAELPKAEDAAASPGFSSMTPSISTQPDGVSSVSAEQPPPGSEVAFVLSFPAPEPLPTRGAGESALLVDANKAGVLGLLTPEPGYWRQNPEPLVKRLVSELARRTDALRSSGEEIQALRRALRDTRAQAASAQDKSAQAAAAREDEEQSLLRATLVDIDRATRAAAAHYSLPVQGVYGSVQGVQASATLMRQGVKEGDGEPDPVPALLRRLVILAGRYAGVRRANAALTGEVHALRAQVRAGAGGGAGLPVPQPGLDGTSTSQMLSVTDTGMSVGVGSLRAGGVGGYELAVAGRSGGLLDPTANVSALSHARLLDAYTGLMEQLQAAHDRGAGLSAELSRMREAHAIATAACAKFQDSGSRLSLLKTAVKRQVEVIAQLEKALTRATGHAQAERARADDLAETVRMRFAAASGLPSTQAALWVGSAGTALARARAGSRAGPGSDASVSWGGERDSDQFIGAAIQSAHSRAALAEAALASSRKANEGEMAALQTRLARMEREKAQASPPHTSTSLHGTLESDLSALDELLSRVAHA